MKLSDFSKDKLKDTHAPFSPSNPTWIKYDEEKFVSTYLNLKAKERGTRLHQLAAEHIELDIKMPDTQNTFDAYVNDCIGFRMRPEELLYYSDFFYGTTDAIKFDGHVLRIHDLKTGVTKAHMEQLEIYAALFCLENHIDPKDIEIELRIYQMNQCIIHKPDAHTIYRLMDLMIAITRVLEKVKTENNL